MKQNEICRYLAAQSPHVLRDLLARWHTRAAKDARFKAQYPTPEAFAVSQLQQVKSLTENPGAKMTLPTDTFARIRAKAASLQASVRVAA